MAYFDDLTPHTYYKNHIGTFCGEHPEFLNIGWLEGARDYTSGVTDAALLIRLKELISVPFAYHYGFHFCDLPPCDGRGEHGTGSVVVCSHAGKWYAAPVLITHYVEAHEYRPPDEFIDAVLNHAYDNLSLLDTEEWDCYEKMEYWARKTAKSDEELIQILRAYSEKHRDGNVV